MTYGKKVVFNDIREMAFGSVTGSYQRIGTVFGHAVQVVILNSTLDVDVYISFDGTNNQFRVASNSFKLLDISANSTFNGYLFIAKGDGVFIKNAGSAPTEGNFWVEAVGSN